MGRERDSLRKADEDEILEDEDVREDQPRAGRKKRTFSQSDDDEDDDGSLVRKPRQSDAGSGQASGNKRSGSPCQTPVPAKKGSDLGNATRAVLAKAVNMLSTAEALKAMSGVVSCCVLALIFFSTQH